MPLLHPAHVLRPGNVVMGAGLSGTLSFRTASKAPDSSPDSQNATNALDQLSTAPALAPWVSGRIGIRGDNEAGLSYSGRSVRLDGRHAFDLKSAALSLGLGATVITAAKQPDRGSDTSNITGGGLDLPILIGYQSKSDVYALWAGPRVGFEYFRGYLQPPVDAGGAGSGTTPWEVSATHGLFGFVAGIRVGFRHIHAALELDGAYHLAEGDLGGHSVAVQQFTLSPAGALIVSF